MCWDSGNLLRELDTDAILRRALSRGGNFADIFGEERSSTLIEIEAGRVDKLVQGVRSGAGVRVLFNHHTAYSYTDLMDHSSLMDCADTASLAAAGPALAPVRSSRRKSGSVLAVSRPVGGIGVKEKLEIMWKAERAAKSFDKRIRQVKVIYADQVRKIAVANNEGVAASDEVTYLVFYVFAVAADESGLQVAHEAAGGTMGLELFETTDPAELALTAARRALLNLEARPAPGGTMPVVLAAEAGGTMVHEAIGHGLEADLAHEGLSVYQGRIGEKVASELVTVVDDSTLAGARGSFSIDDEGTPARRTVLVDKGVLTGYLYDRRMAMKTDGVSTGNGRRESYAAPPIVRMANTMILPGDANPQAIVKSVHRGLLVKRMGGGEVNTVNGDFVFEVEEGWLIERGEAVEPVRGATLTGNGPRALEQIDMVGSDHGFGIGTCGKDGQGVPVSDAQPTLRIPELVVGGRLE